MCNEACLRFVRAQVGIEDVEGRSVLEVGALDVNGSPRPHIESLGPARYVGVDLAQGPGVDELCDVASLVARFGESEFDLVVSTEMVEHVLEWRRAFDQMKRVLRPGGLFVLTTRSKGFPLHGYPHDFWRYELEDMRTIFADFAAVIAERDSPEPGVFVSARKPLDWKDPDLSGVALYSILARRRVRDFGPHWAAAFKFGATVYRAVPSRVRDSLTRRLLKR
jgi:SAM-dependent methyltransferase